MERLQNKAERLRLGANSFVGVEALRVEMGWSRYEERVANLKAGYKMRLEKRGLENWAGYIYRVGEISEWHKGMRKIDQKYKQ